MAYDQGLAQRLREQLQDEPGFSEREMFGGLAFMLAGNMACGVIGDDLIVRVGPERYQEALAEPGAVEFDFTGRPMKGWLRVLADSVGQDAELAAWVDMGRATARSLPPK